MSAPKPPMPHTVIVGGGFAGMSAAQALGKAGHRVTLLDKRNFQLFQPLLYQVATGLLPTGDIAAPHRVLLRRHHSVTVLQSTALDVRPAEKLLVHEFGSLRYDHLIVATGVKHSYFGNDAWAAFAPGLKTLEHALAIRARVIAAFERAERSSELLEQRRAMRFVVVGAGPTGVELAGAIAELAHFTMPGEFRNTDPKQAEIILVEAGKDVLPVYSEKLRSRARAHLAALGVTLRLQTAVKSVDAEGVTVLANGQTERIEAPTVLWAAGVQASAFGEQLAQRTQAQTDRAGRILVDAHCRIPSAPEILVAGDLAALTDAKGQLVPGLAQGALQAGSYAAQLVLATAANKPLPKPFAYKNLGSMAVIGTHKAVGDLRFAEVSGWVGWWIWAVVHVMGLIETRQRLRVFLTWAWRYLTRQVGDRLVTGNPAKTKQLQASLED